jgi:hypothetical protein
MEDSQRPELPPRHSEIPAKPEQPEQPKQQKLSLASIKDFTGQLLQDLRQLQKEGMTLPDILYNYRVQEGRLVRKRPRRGSFAEQDRDDVMAKIVKKPEVKE